MTKPVSVDGQQKLLLASWLGDDVAGEIFVASGLPDYAETAVVERVKAGVEKENGTLGCFHHLAVAAAALAAVVYLEESENFVGGC